MSLPSRLGAPRARRRGVAVLGVIVGALVVAGVALGLLTYALWDDDAGLDRSDARELESAARGVVAVALAELWDPLEHAHTGRDLTLGDVRAHLDAHGLHDGGPVLDLLGRVRLAGTDDDPRFGRSLVRELGVTRRDQGSRTYLDVAATCACAALEPDEEPETFTLVEHFELVARPFAGLSFALLATDLSSVFDHMTVDSAPRWHNRDAERRGSFERVRVGALETLRLRTSTGDSTIAGTLYLGGGGVNAAGAPIVDWGRIDLDGVRLDGLGRLVEAEERAAGEAYALRERNLLAADLEQPERFENLYLGYADPRRQFDGPLPARFPDVFPDADRDGLVDDGEFELDRARYDGRVSASLVRVVEAGERVADERALLDLFVRSNREEVAGCVAGSLVLVGTPERPIEIEGDLLVDGDLVISGFVRGVGRIVARGNVHVPSDIVLLDGSTTAAGRTFGVGADGLPNGLGLVAAGALLVGDVFGPGHVDEHGGARAVELALAEFNRRAWLRAQEFLPAAGTDPRAPRTAGVRNPAFLGLDHVPRYLNLRPGAPVPLALGGAGFDPELRPWNDPAGGAAALVLAAPGDDLLARGTVSALGPAWLDPAMHARMAEHLLAQRPRWKPLAVDAALWGGAGIVAVLDPRSVGLDGRLVVSGAVIAPEFACSAPRGLVVLHDPRAPQLLDVRDHAHVGLRRVRAPRERLE
jgi:hypothetical protein